MNDDRPIAAQFAIFAPLNSEFTVPTFAKILHDVVEALAPLLIRTYTKCCCILFRNARAKSEDGQF